MRFIGQYGVSVFLLLSFLELHLFKYQRTALMICRANNMPTTITGAFCPSWQAITVWVERIIRWSIIIYLLLNGSWMIAIGLVAINFALTTFAPINYLQYAYKIVSNVSNNTSLTQEQRTALILAAHKYIALSRNGAKS